MTREEAADKIVEVFDNLLDGLDEYGPVLQRAFLALTAQEAGDEEVLEIADIQRCEFYLGGVQCDEPDGHGGPHMMGGKPELTTRQVCDALEASRAKRDEAGGRCGVCGGARNAPDFVSDAGMCADDFHKSRTPSWMDEKGDERRSGVERREPLKARKSFGGEICIGPGSSPICPRCKGRTDYGTCGYCTERRSGHDRRKGGEAPCKPNGIVLITAERKRQLEIEGYTEAHDDTHVDGEIANAAACYTATRERRLTLMAPRKGPSLWPWDMEDYHPSPGDRIKELSKAGALIAAEIDRLIRADKAAGGIRADGGSGATAPAAEFTTAPEAGEFENALAWYGRTHSFAQEMWLSQVRALHRAAVEAATDSRVDNLCGEVEMWRRRALHAEADRAARPKVTREALVNEIHKDLACYTSTMTLRECAERAADVALKMVGGGE